VAVHGHILLNGARTELDALIAEAADKALEGRNPEERKHGIRSYVLQDAKPVHNYGTLIRSELETWELGDETPELVREADIILLIGGFDGTTRAARWARIERKPLLPIATFGGVAAKVFKRELSFFDKKYGRRIERTDFEELHSITNDWDAYATNIVDLAEKVGQSRSVLVVMSYADRPDLNDAWATFERVCKGLDYTCGRVDEKNAGTRILPDILERIRLAAFIIVDLTDLRPNVFYELGYADGLGRKVIVTAKKGTELPFDVKDIPTILWESQVELEKKLQKRIQSVMKSAVSVSG
jgi:hypothetical protein